MKRDFTIDTIREWRKKQYDAGLPSGYNDFYTAHGICLTCKGNGTTLSTYPHPCKTCGGSGEVKPNEPSK